MIGAWPIFLDPLIHTILRCEKVVCRFDEKVSLISRKQAIFRELFASKIFQLRIALVESSAASDDDKAVLCKNKICSIRGVRAHTRHPRMAR